MRRNLFTLCSLMIITPSTFAVNEKDNAIQEELKKLEGKWMVLTIEADGKPILEKDKQQTITITGSKFAGFGPEMTFTIDPSRKPKHLTLLAKLKDGDVTINSIYELSKDQLIFAIPLVEKGKGRENTRPEGFDSKGKPVMVITATREK